jgi:hypothetical protein
MGLQRMDRLTVMSVLLATYPAVGEYTITVTITDDGGGVGSDLVNLTISDEPQPTVPWFAVDE